jgi:glycosyltransferase involved in cell wall biosynthesis
MSDNSRESILFSAYPLLPVSDKSCGGAEQILWSVEREMSLRGHKTAVAACESSKVSGELLSTGNAPIGDDRFEVREAEHSAAIAAFARHKKFSMVHDHSGSYWKHAAQLDDPVLATLHLPRALYAESAFNALPHNVYFNCISESQAMSFRDLPRMMPVVQNGIDVDRFTMSRKKDEYLLWMGRICPEKAPHLAIEAAKRAGMKLVLAGQVYPFSYHKMYFENEVRPLLEASKSNVEFVELPSFEQKGELLRRAKALLVTSLIAETSSLVAMEAGACGTPVVALQNGALAEVVQHGHTGFTVHSIHDMVAAIRDVGDIWPDECRHRVETRFSSKAMADGYERLYRRVIEEHRESMALAA